MAAPDDILTDIRAGLAANLKTIKGAQISAYRLANPTPPSIQVAWPDDVKYHESMRNGMDSWVIVVMAFAGEMSDQGAQMVLDKLIAPTGAFSVKAAIEADPTLGGKVDDTVVVSCTGYREYAVGQLAVLGCEWRVEIIASGA